MLLRTPSEGGLAAPAAGSAVGRGPFVSAQSQPALGPAFPRVAAIQ